MKLIQSVTAIKKGWGSAPYRSVSGLTNTEKDAVKQGHLVWFRIEPWHYTQSGYKVVTYKQGFVRHYWDSREPRVDELDAIQKSQESEG